MNKVIRRGRLPIYARGLTLVELMVSVALGLLLIAGAINIFLSSRQVYRTEEAMSLNQENGRFAIHFLNKKIRNAGYVGCSNLTELNPFVIADPPPANGFMMDTAVIGYEGNGANGAGMTWTNPSSVTRVDGTDIITIYYGGECDADLTGNMNSVNAEIQLSGGAGGCGFEAGDYLLLTDCESADLFRASSVSAASGKITIAHASNVNTANFLSKIYQAGSSIMFFKRSTYFIGLDENGKPGLYWIEDNSTTAQELLENVQDMQFTYGIDTGADGVIDSYQTASAIADWSRVVGVKVNLLVRSDDDSVTTQPQVVAFNGVSVNAGAGADRRLRTVFNTTATIRNRVP